MKLYFSDNYVMTMLDCADNLNAEDYTKCVWAWGLFIQGTDYDFAQFLLDMSRGIDSDICPNLQNQWDEPEDIRDSLDELVELWGHDYE